MQSKHIPQESYTNWDSWNFQLHSAILKLPQKNHTSAFGYRNHIGLPSITHSNAGLPTVIHTKNILKFIALYPHVAS